MLATTLLFGVANKVVVAALGAPATKVTGAVAVEVPMVAVAVRLWALLERTVNMALPVPSVVAVGEDRVTDVPLVDQVTFCPMAGLP